MKLKNALILSVSLLVVGSIAVSRHNKESLSAGIGLMNSPALLARSEEQIDGASDFDKAQETTEERAERIAHGVNELSEIEKVSVIITGNSAIIGIEISGDLNDRKLIALKQDVEKKVKAIDDTIDHVAVTAVGELIKRMDKIADYRTDLEKSNSLNEEQEETINSLTPVF